MTKYLLPLLFLSLLGCDLEPQERFEYDPEIPEQITFEDQTAWNWLTNDAQASEFSIFIEAIQVAEMVEEYDDPSDRRTFFFLKNRAFTDGGELFAVFGTDSLPAVDRELLRTVLRYHIVEEYIDQGPDALPVLLTDYIFQTLVPGDDGRISVNRDERFRLSVNRSSELPSTRRGTRIGQHNYIFSNGIAHFTNDYFRIRPY